MERKVIRLLLSLVTVGAVISCQVEDTEQTSGTLNVDPNSEQEVPEWVTVRDLDHNRDGIIDIRDLVIISKFFGQEVPEADIASASDESDPCQDIKAKRYDNLKIVDGDNADMKETFAAPDGTYVYALIALIDKGRDDLESSKPPKGSFGCLAIRLLISDNLLPKSVIAKPVTGFVNHFTKPIEYELHAPHKPHTYEIGKSYNRYYWRSPRKTQTFRGEGSGGYFDMTVNFDFIFDYDISSYPESDHSYLRERKVVEKQKYYTERLSKSGIPIGGDRTINYLYLKYDHRYNWSIRESSEDDRRSIEELLTTYGHRGSGVYLKMLPAEVRAKYFREDIEATGN